MLQLCDFISKKKSTRLDKNYSDISKRGLGDNTYKN